MKKSIWLSIIVVLCLVVLSCSNSSNPSETEEVKGFDGQWKITLLGSSYVCTIKTGDTYMYFDGLKYTGSYSGNSFTGTNTQNNSGVKYVYKLQTTRNGDKISGSIKATVTLLGQSESNTESFSGYRYD